METESCETSEHHQLQVLSRLQDAAEASVPFVRSKEVDSQHWVPHMETERLFENTPETGNILAGTES